MRIRFRDSPVGKQQNMTKGNESFKVSEGAKIVFESYHEELRNEIIVVSDRTHSFETVLSCK